MESLVPERLSSHLIGLQTLDHMHLPSKSLDVVPLHYEKA